MFSGIYCIKNIINNKVYIGQAKNVFVRLKNHFRALKNNVHENSHLQASWNKYGSENFECFVICQCPKQQLSLAEISSIWAFSSRNPDFGFNKTNGGNCPPPRVGFNHTAETKKLFSIQRMGNKFGRGNLGRKLDDTTKKKISISHLGDKNPFYGKQHSLETKNVMSQKQTGIKKKNYPRKPHSEETKRKISLSRIGEKNPFFGKKHSDKTKKEISDSVKITKAKQKGS